MFFSLPHRVHSKQYHLRINNSAGSNNNFNKYIDLFRSRIIWNIDRKCPPPLSLEADLDQYEACIFFVYLCFSDNPSFLFPSACLSNMCLRPAFVCTFSQPVHSAGYKRSWVTFWNWILTICQKQLNIISIGAWVKWQHNCSKRSAVCFKNGILFCCDWMWCFKDLHK